MNPRDIFEILVREHRQNLHAFIRATVLDSQSADDIWQETMMIAWQKLEQYDRDRPFGPWLKGIASKLILARSRANARHLLISDESQLEYLANRFEQFNSLAGDTFNDKLSALRDCIARLPEKDKECVQLRYLDELTTEQLAHRLNLAFEATKKRLTRAKSRLIECLTNKFPNEFALRGEHGTR